MEIPEPADIDAAVPARVPHREGLRGAPGVPRLPAVLGLLPRPGVETNLQVARSVLFNAVLSTLSCN